MAEDTVSDVAMVDGEDAAATEAPAEPAAPKVVVPSPPLFGKYDTDGVTVRDPGLVRYINLSAVGIPHQGAKYANRPFGKARVSIVERLINGMMRGEEFTGKKLKSYKLVQDAFAVVSDKTKENPIQVLVDALQNAAPKEEITRLRYGGIKVPKAVDVSPQRRIDIALRNLCTGARQATYKNKKSAAQCLAEEILRAAKGDMQSFAVAKKEDIERVAKSAR